MSRIVCAALLASGLTLGFAVAPSKAANVSQPAPMIQQVQYYAPGYDRGPRYGYYGPRRFYGPRYHRRGFYHHGYYGHRFHGRGYYGRRFYR